MVVVLVSADGVGDLLASALLVLGLQSGGSRVSVALDGIHATLKSGFLRLGLKNIDDEHENDDKDDFDEPSRQTQPCQ